MPKIDMNAAAEQLGVDKRTVRRLISSGELRAYRVGRTTAIRVDSEDVAELLIPVVPNHKR